MLALLLHDREMRDRFRADRSAFVKEFGLEGADTQMICSLDCEQLDRQAEGLLRKRKSQVTQLIPRTWNRLGVEANRLFRDYVESSAWPESHQRHALDADAFCSFLQLNSIQEYSRSEHNWLKFCIGKCWFRLHFVSDCNVDNRNRWAVQVFYRTRASGTVQRTIFCGSMKSHR